MALIECSICGDIPDSELYYCCKNCQPAYQKIKRLEERLSKEEEKVDFMQEQILSTLHKYPAEFKEDKVTIESKLFLKLWDIAELRWHNADKFDSFLDESLVEGRVLIDAFKLFHSEKNIREGFKTPIKEKLNRLYESCIKTKEFHNWTGPKEDFDFTVEDFIKQVKEL